MNLLPVLLLVLPPVQDPAGQEPAAKAEAPKVRGHFGWKVPGKVRVVERITKAGREAEVGFTLVLTPAPDGKGILVRHEDHRFVSLDGKKPSEIGDAAGYQQAMAFVQAAPDLRIGADGKVLEVLAVDRAIEAMLTTFAELMTEEQREAHLPQLEARFKQADMRLAIEAATRSHWDNWVGNWVGLDLPETGKMLETEVETPLLTGAKTPARISVSNRGPAEDHAGCVELRSISVVEGGKFIDVVVDMTRKMVPPQMRDRVTKDMFEKASLEQRLRSVLRLGSLEPDLVVHERIVTVKPKGQDAQQQVERREYRFDWGAAADGSSEKGGEAAEAAGK